MAEAIRYNVRYEVKWGHTLNTKEGPVEVTRREYNAAFGWPTPDPPEVPEEAMHAWKLWMRLNARRQPAEGVSPMSYSELLSYQQLTGDYITPETLRMLEAIDDSFVATMREEKAAACERKVEETNSVSGKGKGGKGGKGGKN